MCLIIFYSKSLKALISQIDLIIEAKKFIINKETNLTKNSKNKKIINHTIKKGNKRIKKNKKK